MELPYWSCYCEENIYKACETLQSDLNTVTSDCLLYVVFISSSTRSVPLFCQRSSHRKDGLVIWDYHVVLIKVVNDISYVLDFDTTIRVKNEQLNVRDGFRKVEFIPFREYAESTFRHSLSLPADLRRYFRVISSKDYLSTFASDRSHMLVVDEGGRNKYSKTPPPWLQICGSSACAAGIFMNIDSYIDMMNDGDKCNDRSKILAYDMKYGEVLTEEQFLKRFLTSVDETHNMG
ncbi:N-terminal glutamine amidase-domain-containing protein [Lipomyces kononenkoae]|uniref:N-terminal glutamine amidase-domain-containing protein n=1 Tax=Lipomyces kononenkoae TaxID=34357 RepID=A0ACC3STE2_LIPKO